MKRILFLLALTCGTLFAQAQVNPSMNMTLLSSYRNANFFYNDIWGYTDPNGREYAILGSNWGTHFFDITNPSQPIQVDSFIGQNSNSIWRDYKTYGHYCYAVGDGGGHSLQIFDMSGLPNQVVKVYDSNALSTSAHTLNIENGKLYLVSNSKPNGYAPIDILSLADPENPTYMTSIGAPFFSGMHAMHVRNDTLYCSAGFAGQRIIDATDPFNPTLVSSLIGYPSPGYNHSSWTSGDRQHMIFTDEVPSGLPAKIYDISDITNPTFVSFFSTGTLATAHNTFMWQDYAILSYYKDGVQVWDMSNPATPQRIGFLDTYPDNDSTNAGYNSPDPYDGAWGVFPYFASGTIIASDVTHGLKVMTPPYGPPYPDPSIANPLSTAPQYTVGNLSVSPNPASDFVYVSLPEGVSQTRISIINTLGQTVNTQTLQGQNGQISLKHLASGLYTLQADVAGKRMTRKVVVE
jgi:choice-of-anchor B domain-containing protein